MSPLVAVGGSDGGGAAGGGGVAEAIGGGAVGEPTCEGVPAFADGGVEAIGSKGPGFGAVDAAAGGGADGIGFGGGAACATGGFAVTRADESLSSRPG